MRLVSILRSLPLLTMLALSTSPAMAGSDDPLEKLYQAALAAGESTVTVYNPSTAANAPIFKAFEARFPKLAVKGVDLFGAALMARLEAEYASGKPQVDLLYTIPADTPAVAKKGFLVPYRPETATGLAETYVGDGDLWLDWTLTLGGPYYNSNSIKPEEAPKSYQDLVDPKWKGRLSMSSLRVVTGTGQALTALTRDKVIDRSWLEKLAALQPIIAQSNAAAIQAVANGQADVGIDVPYHFYLNAIKKGAPFKYVFPTDGVISVPLSAAVVKDAPHANAARLLSAWFFSSEAQKVVADIGMQGTMPGAPHPQGAPSDLVMHVIDWRTLEKLYPAQLELYRTLFSN